MGFRIRAFWVKGSNPRGPRWPKYPKITYAAKYLPSSTHVPNYCARWAPKLEASKGGMKVGRVKNPLYKNSYQLSFWDYPTYLHPTLRAL